MKRCLLIFMLISVILIEILNAQRWRYEGSHSRERYDDRGRGDEGRRDRRREYERRRLAKCRYRCGSGADCRYWEYGRRCRYYRSQGGAGGRGRPWLL
uniref:Uncharacterized protein n=1 Tax=Romanomermis culicivorax TaxID=13658 RepID=A0A915IQ48_ROMCU